MRKGLRFPAAPGVDLFCFLATSGAFHPTAPTAKLPTLSPWTSIPVEKFPDKYYSEPRGFQASAALWPRLPALVIRHLSQPLPQKEFLW